jgi:hypothetical protein
MLSHPKDEEDGWLHRLILPEEEVIVRHPHTRGSPQRWFRSPNIIDLWTRRSHEDRIRISERMKIHGLRW